MATPTALEESRTAIQRATLADETVVVTDLINMADLDAEARQRIVARGTALVDAMRRGGGSGLMEHFLAEYGLSTKEGVALMCLAEALLRVPDAETIDALIEDKIAASDWSAHLGRASSPLVNASTWALLLTGRVLKEDDDGSGLVGTLRAAVKRLGEPVIRTAVGQAMKRLGHQFVLGRSIGDAMARAVPQEAKGNLYSYDMLGEAACTEADARRYHVLYADAITALAPSARAAGPHDNPGISVKLSALHPRYEPSQRGRVLAELVPRVRALASLARSANLGFTIDAEEMRRLDLSLDVIAAVLVDPALGGWDGFGVVVQSYGPRAAPVIAWLSHLARQHGRRIAVRLVKGAYWDTEIKRAQMLGLDGFPVFSRKVVTDVAYIACARRLLGLTDHVYPQFATHNAHTAAAVLEMAGDAPRHRFEFQRLHGMGEALHAALKREAGTRCRIYAPVGAHEDLLAYLVRRLLENGANNSFVNQVVDPGRPAVEIAADPFAQVEALGAAVAHPRIRRGPDLFAPGRCNARGWDLADPVHLAILDAGRDPFRHHRWEVGPLLAGTVSTAADPPQRIRNPSDAEDVVGTLVAATPADVDTALTAATAGFPAWSGWGAPARAIILRRAAELYEDHAGELFALAAREAGKSPADCIAELREAVDFLHYYAGEAERLTETGPPRGVFACISPWNFPLAIFTGQIAAALAAGNTVVAKPAEQTPLIAVRAATLLHQAGVPTQALQVLPGDGATLGGALVGDPRLAGVCFTGSTATAQAIHRRLAATGAADAPLIAETGGLNAMIVDSTALPEQTVHDVVASAFQSAGQRCSALRVLYLQREVADRFLTMLLGLMDELRLGDPWDVATDVGPVIDAEARGRIEAHIAAAQAEGRVLKRLPVPKHGQFVGPTVIRVTGIGDLSDEVFGPVLHVATFAAGDLDRVVDAVNAAGYGLTFALHTRIDDRVQHVVDRVRVGNIYVNRNQIGSIVGSQPFGGEGLSGTGPKAGGPLYLRRFLRPASGSRSDSIPSAADILPFDTVQAAIDALPLPDPTARRTVEMPGPTGELNRLSILPRGVVLCLGPGPSAAQAQAVDANAAGCPSLRIVPGAAGSGSLDGWLDPATLTDLLGFAAVAFYGNAEAVRPVRQALARRDGPILPLLTDPGPSPVHRLERHLCVDTTAAGGNASLLAAAV